MFCHQCGNAASLEASFCPKCGVRLSQLDQARTVDIAQTGKSSYFDCPKCKRDDQVQRISAIIDGGTTNTVGGVITAPILGQGALTGGMYAGVSRTQLASRLISYARPSTNFIGNLLRGVFFGYLAAYAIVLILEHRTHPSFDGGDLIFLLFLAAFPSFITIPIAWWVSHLLNSSRIRPSQLKWDQDLDVIRGSYYCSRDDVCFNDVLQGVPEDFAYEIFHNFSN